MKLLWWKSRDYPIQRDEFGRSMRKQAFELFDEGYRPAQVFKQSLVAAPMKTLLRYFEDWKKRTRVVSRSRFRKFMKENPEFSEKFIKDLADYFGVSTEDIILRMHMPWGIARLSKGELADARLYRIRIAVEYRLDAALRLIYLGEKAFQNNPEQVKQLAWDIITLKDNTRLVIAKTNGQILVRKERFKGRN